MQVNRRRANSGATAHAHIYTMEKFHFINKPITDQAEQADDMSPTEHVGQPSNGVTVTMTDPLETKSSNLSQDSQEESRFDILITALKIAIQRVKEENSGQVNPDSEGKSNYPTTTISSAGETCLPAKPSSARKGNKPSTNMNMEHGSPRSCCEVCSEKFRDAKSLRTHLKKVHDNPSRNSRKYSCSFCKAVFADKRYLKTHEKGAHNGTPQAFCDECPAHFVSPSFLRVHKVNAHRKSQRSDTHTNYAANTGGADADSTCDICQRKCSNPRNLKAHKHLSHSGTPTAFCDICPAHFGNTRSLSLHKTGQHYESLKASGGVRKKHRRNLHFCTKCNYTSVYKFNVTRHQRDMHGDAPEFTCTYGCGYIGKTTTSRKIHELSCYKGSKRE